MKVLIVGSGGREHAIAWAIRKTNSENLKIYVAPGNAGTLPFATNVNIQITEIVELATFAKENNIPNINFIRGDIFAKIFEDEIFDFILCNGVLHHTANPFKAFCSIVPYFKINGYILMTIF